MVTSLHGANSRELPDITLATSNPASSNATSTSSASSSASAFTQELLNALQTVLNQSKSGSSFEIDVTPGSGQNSASSQITITVKDLGPQQGTTTAGTSPGTSTAPSATTPKTTTGSTQSTPPTETPAAAASTSQSTPVPIDPSAGPSTTYDPPADEADLYWDAQPPAVQQLRNITDPTQRMETAQQLAEEGYTIDVPIMAWGWDPYTTMYMREQYGYTWVPSALQSPVEVEPGLSIPGLSSYNPSNPPSGSIAVTTNFADLPQLENLPQSQSATVG